jgi:hypothetical protein
LGLISTTNKKNGAIFRDNMVPGFQQLRSFLPSSETTKSVGGVLVSKVALGIAMLFGLIGMCFYGYMQLGPQIASRPEFLLSEESFQVTPQPDWVPGDVRLEVIRDSELLKSNLLDPKLTLDVARAFGLHTWVAKVDRVRKSSGPILAVELQYRQPLAMVEVYNGNEPGVIPVDSEAVILPPSDFSEADLDRFIRITTDFSMPTTPAGTPWGDDRVAVAAVLANRLQTFQKKLAVYRIHAVSDVARPRSRVLVTLEGKAGGKVILGPVPRDTAVLATSEVSELSKLQNWMRSGGNLSDLTASEVIDLRSSE